MDMRLGMVPAIQFPNQLYSNQIPRVNGTAEAKSYPTVFGSEMALLDSTDDTILYIKKTDTNGAVALTRYRFFEDPEPTQQEINDSRYLTKEDFDQKLSAFREEMLNAIKNRGKGNNGYRSNDSVKENV